ncbi:MAG: hypothetical protein ACE367_25260 [Acidimicrobiales bacterium]
MPRIRNIGIAALLSLAVSGCGGALSADSASSFCEIGEELADRRDMSFGEPDEVKRELQKVKGLLEHVQRGGPEGVRGDMAEAIADVEAFDAALAYVDYDVTALHPSKRRLPSWPLWEDIERECSSSFSNFSKIANNIPS